MRPMSLVGAGAIVIVLAAAGLAQGPATARIRVDLDHPGPAVSPLLYGIFFEEINRAGEGGIYAEMVQNRSFEDQLDVPIGWSLAKDRSARGGIALDASRPLNARNVHALRIDVGRDGSGRVGVANEGFQGIAVEPGGTYRLTLFARAGYGFGGVVKAALEMDDGQELGTVELGRPGLDWKRLSGTLVWKPQPDLSPEELTTQLARLVISIEEAGQVWIDQVSLMPVSVPEDHPFRPDLLERLRAMRPAFVRFPGGCYVEGDRLSNAFRWKDSIGDPAERPGHWNLWGYRSSDGLGFHEYLQLCEDLKAEPLFVANCGMAHEDHATPEHMTEFVQDALDAIEYANGDAQATRWGALRAKHGHPAPFGLKLLEIGNENGGPVYEQAYGLFHDAIKARFPDVRLISNVALGSRPLEIVDEHYYNSPEFFLRNATRYDRYDRKGPRIYVGEYAVTRGAGEGNLIAALGEAAFMTGMERNGDVVVMSSYAPLFVHPGWRRWNPNAIVFDAAQSYGTPSYHVQALFAAHRADVNLPVQVDAKASAPPPLAGLIGVGTWATQAEFKEIRVTDPKGETVLASDFSEGHDGWAIRGGTWEAEEGALRQTSNDNGACAYAGPLPAGDFTLSLKARKLDGAEGFLVSFLTPTPDPGRKNWWNVGGWGNARHGLEHEQLAGESKPGRIETGRWYDLRVDVRGESVKCFLDGELVHTADRAAIRPLYAVAGRASESGEVILKVVNPTGEAIDTQVELAGGGSVGAMGKAIVLAGPGPDAENSFEEPEAVVPRERELAGIGKTFRHVFPAYSVTVLRVAGEP